MYTKLGDRIKVSRADHVKLNVSPCLSICGVGPLVVIYPDGIWYHHVDDEAIERIVNEHLLHHQPVTELAIQPSGRMFSSEKDL
jgi:cob(I)alamin adenosyltransferase